MIENFIDLIKYTNICASKYPSIANRIEIRACGVSKEDVRRLSSNLPPVYCRCIESLSLFGVSIGPFELWPSLEHDKGLIESLNAANSSSMRWFDMVKAKKMCVVGCQDADVICVGENGSDKEDVVFLLDISTSHGFGLVEMAPDFETFLLIAANYMALCDDFEDSNPEKVVSDIYRCALRFKCSQAQSEYWRDFARHMTC